MGRTIAALLLFLSITACSTIPPHHSDIYPYRTVTVTTVAGKGVTCDDAEWLYAETNRLMMPQVGVALRQEVCVDDEMEMAWDPRDSGKDLMRRFPEPKTDMVIWLDDDKAKQVGSGIMRLLMMPQVQAAIDDVYRRYVAMRGLDPQILLHEMGHAFIFSHVHSKTGVMIAGQIQILPGLPVIPIREFSEEDRQEILRNKFRNFAEKIQWGKKVGSEVGGGRSSGKPSEADDGK